MKVPAFLERLARLSRSRARTRARTAVPESPETSLWHVRTWIWMLVFVAVTSAAFSPGISFRGGSFPAGTIARRDVVAPRDFIVPDPETTDQKRAEAAARVLPVYDRDSEAAVRLEDQLHAAFDAAREKEKAAAGRRGRAPAQSDLKTAFGLPISDEGFAALARAKFSPTLESRLVAISERLYRNGVVDNKELLLQNRERGVTIRDTSGGAERRTIDLYSTVEYGSDLKSAVNADLVSTSLRGRDAREVAGFLASLMKPNLTYNAAETSARRTAAAEKVESVFVKVPRGEVIVRRGDLISPKAARLIGLIQGSASEPRSWWRLTGVVALQVLAVFLFWLDTEVRKRSGRGEASPLLPILAVGIVFAVIDRGAFAIAQSLASSFSSDALSADSYAIPFAAGPVVAVLVAGVGPGPAVLFAAVTAASVGVLMGMNYAFVLFALTGSLAGIYGMKRLGARSVLLGLGGIVAAANVLAVLVLRALSGEAEGLVLEMASAAVGGLLVAALVAFLLPVFESVFHVTTDIRLLELSNLNLPILRTLAFEAPGTYQHSLMVGHLAEAAAEAIGANPLLARVCAYYHDIGKTRMPEYFIENQVRGRNRHDRLEPSMSALIIASHVKEGAELARRNRLPEPIITGIREHHGTKLIRYFYQKALTKAAPDAGPVLESDYRYPGPKPSNRITGILMLSDAVEAASRTILEPTPAKITAMVRAISSDCLRDGQFDRCDLTMRDLSRINEALIRTVTTMFHHRIDYPGFDFNRAKAETRLPRRSTGGVRVTSK
jgi:putative nucleotidyltransferase with HDIG domain